MWTTTRMYNNCYTCFNTPIIILVEAEFQTLTSIPTEGQTACIGDYRKPLHLHNYMQHSMKHLCMKQERYEYLSGTQIAS